MIDNYKLTLFSLKKSDEVRKQMRDSNLDEPVVATLTPGIGLDEIMETGVDGIAVSNTSTLPTELPHMLAMLTTILKLRLADN